MDLHQQFVSLGKKRHQLRNELLALLPLIFTSGIYKKYAGSIVEYAGKFGDIPRSTTLKRLRLEDNLRGKPHLKAAIKQVGINKVSLVARIATPETEKALADTVIHMSKSAVQQLSKELRGKSAGKKITVELDEEMTTLFLRLKNKFGHHMSNQAVMKLVLKKMTAQEFPEKKLRKSVTGQKVARYIPAAKKRTVSTQCSYPHCNKPTEVFHHRIRFCNLKSHDSIVPLCTEHHEFAHNGLISNEQSNPQSWKLSLSDRPLPTADRLYRDIRNLATYPT